MIKYKLFCKNCDHKFDSWFASSTEYERLKKKKLLTCHQCYSSKVEKTIMAPQLINRKSKIDEKINFNKFNEVKKTIINYQKFIRDNFKYVGDNFAYEARSIHYDNKKIKEYQKFIKNNFEYVGENFTYEARSIHYSKKKNKKNIFGKASIQDVKELKEEGIDAQMIPWINENEN